MRNLLIFALLINSTPVIAVSEGQEQSNGQSDLQKDFEEARTGAEQGVAKQQAALAFYYQWGVGVKKDELEASHWYRKAAEQGYLGAQFQLATMYESGKGVLQDYSEASHWYHKAAEQGYLRAQVSLADMYGDGMGVPQDYAEAAHWYREAAEQGDPGAQFRLGTMCSDGKGVPQDYVEAHMWINLAVSRIPGSFGSDEVRQEMAGFRDRLEAKMTPEQVSQAQRLAHDWKPRTAKESRTPAK